MSVFLFWLLWIAGFAIFTATRFLPLLFTTPAFRRKWLPTAAIYSLIGAFAVGGGIVQFQSLTPSARAQPIGPLGIFVVSCLLVAVLVQLIRDIVRTAASALVSKGNQLLGTSKYEDALADYDRALRYSRWFTNDQSRATVWSAKASALLQLGRYDEALTACEKALALAPSLASAWALEGNVLTSQLRYSEAVYAYEKALTLRPNVVQLLAPKAYALERAGRTEEALATSEQALRLIPTSGMASPLSSVTASTSQWLALAWTARARALNALGRSEEALTAAEVGIGQFPQIAAMHLAKAQVLTRLQRTNEAQATAAEAVRAADQQLATHPRAVPILIAKANALRLLGHETDADAIEAQVRALLPTLTIVDGRAV